MMCRRLLLIAAAITASIEAGSASYHPGISSDYSGYPGFAAYSALTPSKSSSGATTTPAISLDNALICRYQHASSTLAKKYNFQFPPNSATLPLSDTRRIDWNLKLVPCSRFTRLVSHLQCPLGIELNPLIRGRYSFERRRSPLSRDAWSGEVGAWGGWRGCRRFLLSFYLQAIRVPVRHRELRRPGQVLRWRERLRRQVRRADILQP